MYCDDPGQKSLLRQDAEEETYTLLREFVDPNTLPRLHDDEVLEPYPRRAPTNEDAPLVRAGEAKWEREEQLRKHAEADWARRFESAYKSDAVQGAGAGSRTSPREISSEKQGGCAAFCPQAQESALIV